MRFIKWDRWSMSTKRWLVFSIIILVFGVVVSTYFNVQAYAPSVMKKNTKAEIVNILLQINDKQDPAIVELIADTIIEACDIYDQDYYLVISLIWKESRCKRYAKNPESGAACLMQLLLNEKELVERGLKGEHSIYNIKDCVMNGVLTLYKKYTDEELLKRGIIDGSTKKALLAYGGFVTEDGNLYVADVMCFKYDLERK